MQRIFFSLSCLCVFYIMPIALADSAVEIEFYHDDGQCSPDSFIFKYAFTGDMEKDLRLCNFIVANLNANIAVWGARVNGNCRDLGDRPLSGLCQATIDNIQAGSRL